MEIKITDVFKSALKFHISGDIHKAEELYKLLIKHSFSHPAVLSNYGVICASFGRVNEAKDLYKQSINIFPNSPEAYSNYASLLISEGKYQESESLLRIAIKLKPDLIDACLNLGTAVNKQNRSEESIEIARRTLKLAPTNPNSYINLLSFLTSEHNLQESIDLLLEAIEKFPTNEKLFIVGFDYLREKITCQTTSKNLRTILIKFLNSDFLYHNLLFNLVSSFYKVKFFEEITLSKSNVYSENVHIDFFADELFLLTIKRISLMSITWEKLMIRLRKDFLEYVVSSKFKFKHVHFEFVIALAQQCFLNEYCYFISNYEIGLIKELEQKINSNKLNEVYIAIFSCYFPMTDLKHFANQLVHYKSKSTDFNELIKMQVLDGITEKSLIPEIASIGNISDSSLEVKEQYEQNPYPRWRYTHFRTTAQDNFSNIVNNEIAPNNIFNIPNKPNPTILIAGCGTGYQLINTSRYLNAEITAIDLSKQSLVYAKRKSIEYGMKNIEFYQMDILNLPLLNKKYDCILCTGVLHHMQNPTIGLERILECLSPNGLLKLGLYSELAREVIVKARSFIQSNSIQPKLSDIRQFRSQIINDQFDEFKGLLKCGDFYTISGARDLCFNVQEIRYNLTDLEKLLNKHNLDFKGFILPPDIKKKYASIFPEDHKQISLFNWNKYEEMYPTTFKAMYQFWLSKSSS